MNNLAESIKEYQEYKAESRACGYEVETFQEWLGEGSANAENQWQVHSENDTLDLY
jgi:hypothetical protein